MHGVVVVGACALVERVFFVVFFVREGAFDRMGSCPWVWKYWVVYKPTVSVTTVEALQLAGFAESLPA